MSTLVFDIETNGLFEDVSKIHCIAIKEIAGSVDLYVGSDIRTAISRLKSADRLVGHNIVQFDIPVINKITGVDLSKKDTFDTLIASRFLYPDIEGGHSIEAWAKKLGGTQKTQITDWSTYTPEMGERCSGDITINESLYLHILGNIKPWGEIDFHRFNNREQHVARIHHKQVCTGVKFDLKKAVKLINRLDARARELTHLILEDAPVKLTVDCLSKKDHSNLSSMTVDDVKAPFKKDGSLKSNVKLHGLPNVKGPYVRVSFDKINLNSDQQVKEFLLELGWKPTTWNFTIDASGNKVRSSPQLTEDSYGSLPPGLGQQIAELSVIEHRRNYLLSRNDKTKGALVSVRYDEKIPAEAITCGTPTFRYRHKGVVCNVPRPGTPYGEDIRELFTTNHGCAMIGVDLEQIEARMMCHYVLFVAKSSKDHSLIAEAEQMVDLVINGDYHSYNADNWGVTRNTAKSGLYALMYGCGEAKLANTLGKKSSEGKKFMNIFWDNNKPLQRLIATLESAYRSHPGYISGFDGSILRIRDLRKLLNTLLQSSAAIVFKKWMTMVDDLSIPDLHQIIAYHDELQFEVEDTDESLLKIHCKTLEDLAESAGKELGVLVPIKAKAKVGFNWKETH